VKIGLNLAPSQSFRQRHVLAWSLPLLAISLALLIRLVFSIQTNWIEYRSVGRSVLREQDRRNELAAREAGLKRQLDEPANRALLREVQFVNSVIDQRQFSFTEMEAKVTALLPPEVRLTALSMPDNAGEPLIHVGVEGSSEGPVETFLINLEDSPDFRDTMITGAGFDEKGNGSPVGISCTAHYVSGRGTAKGAETPGESSGAGAEKAGSRPGSKQTSPAKTAAPRELTTAPRVAAGLAAARANPGVPVKIGTTKMPPVQKGSSPKVTNPSLPVAPAPAGNAAGSTSPAGPAPK
jgi:Tfp pilus assembly protein PilN